MINKLPKRYDDWSVKDAAWYTWDRVNQLIETVNSLTSPDEKECDVLCKDQECVCECHQEKIVVHCRNAEEIKKADEKEALKKKWFSQEKEEKCDCGGLLYKTMTCSTCGKSNQKPDEKELCLCMAVGLNGHPKNEICACPCHQEKEEKNVKPYKNCNCDYPYIVSCTGLHEVACNSEEEKSSAWITAEDKENIIRLAGEGKTNREIVEELGLKYPAVARIVKMCGVSALKPPKGQTPKPFDPDEERGIRL